MRRRDFLGAAALAACGRALPAARAMPAIFVAHGSPMLLDDAAWVRELRAWAGALPAPRAILVLSAHWEAAPATLGATTTVPLRYDFDGFPDRYYRQTYPAPGAPDLAARVRGLVTAFDNPARGLDHGAYVPLVAMYPAADVPVLQLSLPSLAPRRLFELGRALAPLRDEGVLIVGSGFLTHNLFAGDFAAPPDVVTASWAADFDAWCADVLSRRDVDALLDYERRAPAVDRALPSREHFVPVIVAAGAASDADVTFPIAGWMAGTFTRRSVQLG